MPDGGSPRIEGQSDAAASSSTSGPEAMRSTPMETGEERGCRNPPASSLGPEPKRPVTIDAEAGPEPKKPRPDAEMNVDSVVDAEARESDDEECDWVPEVTDSRTGQILDPKLVETAREEELKFMEGFGIFEETSVEECRRETGRMPVDTKWVDVNKGSEAEPVVRSRLAARDFKPKGEKERGDLFAAMPPLEAKKMLFSIAASHPRVLRRGKWMRPKLMFIDVKKGPLERRREGRREGLREHARRPSGEVPETSQMVVWHEACRKRLGGGFLGQVGWHGAQGREIVIGCFLRLRA